VTFVTWQCHARVLDSRRMDAADLASRTLDQLRTRLSEALDALHALQMGQRAVQWRYGDKGARFSETDIPRLEA
jgi:hypothetical protein